MAKNTYTAINPDTNAIDTVSTGRTIAWFTYYDFNDGRGLFQGGLSSADTHDKAIRAAKSSNPYAARYAAVPATLV